MNTNMNTSTLVSPIGIGLRPASARRSPAPAPAQLQRLPKLALSAQTAARAAAPAQSSYRLVLPAPRESAAEKVAFLVVALSAGAALAEACGLMARLAPQWDAFTDLVARLIA